LQNAINFYVNWRFQHLIWQKLGEFKKDNEMKLVENLRQRYIKNTKNAEGKIIKLAFGLRHFPERDFIQHGN
jgi:hypothetical protein